MTPISPAPKPEPAPPKKRQFIKRESDAHREKRLNSPPKFRKPISRSLPPGAPKTTTASSKRRARNAKYYQSPEWREKKRLTHERDGYRCVELIHAVLRGFSWVYPDVGVRMRCENRGEVVNGKQTARGLVCEEKSYGHRGISQRIDTCVTRCKSCDRRLTPLERANHKNGFRKVGGKTS